MSKKSGIELWVSKSVVLETHLALCCAHQIFSSVLRNAAHISVWDHSTWTSGTVVSFIEALQSLRYSTAHWPVMSPLMVQT